jgi:hypothetical protein
MAQNDQKTDSVFAIPIGYNKKKPALPWFEARVRVNKYLLHKVGSAFIADAPKLVDAEKLLLAVPILYTLSKKNNQKVGQFCVKADTNEIVFEHSDSREQIYENAGIDRKDTLSSTG